MAPTDSTILLSGESGTGKDLLARAIHHAGSRRNAPFVALDLGTVTPTLVASELFGHARGAFTGATERNRGKFELATGGNDISKATAGVSINMVTKRGTNEIRGSARYLITDQDLFWFFKQSSPAVDPDDFPPGQGSDVETTQIDRIEWRGGRGIFE